MIGLIGAILSQIRPLCQEMFMDELMRRVLKIYEEMEAESLDLHMLFEAGGNDPATRERVLDAVAALVRNGLLEARGSDFYAITDKGRVALASR
jgi:DNA-binding PadR family transcriptional regulator